MFLREVYAVFLDGNFVGICENEDECWEVAQNTLNGIDVLLDDDVDRVWWNTIGVNRFYQDGKNICDKFSNNSILCYDYVEAKSGLIKLNKLNLKKERAEAKLRAMAL